MRPSPDKSVREAAKIVMAPRVLPYQAGRIAEFEPNRWRQAQGWICIIVAMGLLVLAGACAWEAAGATHAPNMSARARLGICIFTFGFATPSDLNWLDVVLAATVGLGGAFVCCVLGVRRLNAARYRD